MDMLSNIILPSSLLCYPINYVGSSQPLGLISFMPKSFFFPSPLRLLTRCSSHTSHIPQNTCPTNHQQSIANLSITPSLPSTSDPSHQSSTTSNPPYLHRTISTRAPTLPPLPYPTLPPGTRRIPRSKPGRSTLPRRPCPCPCRSPVHAYPCPPSPPLSASFVSAQIPVPVARSVGGELLPGYCSVGFLAALQPQCTYAGSLALTRLGWATEGLEHHRAAGDQKTIRKERRTNGRL